MEFAHNLREENQYAPERTSTEAMNPSKSMHWSTRLVCSGMGENRVGMI